MRQRRRNQRGSEAERDNLKSTVHLAQQGPSVVPVCARRATAKQPWRVLGVNRARNPRARFVRLHNIPAEARQATHLATGKRVVAPQPVLA